MSLCDLCTHEMTHEETYTCRTCGRTICPDCLRVTGSKEYCESCAKNEYAN